MKDMIFVFRDGLKITGPLSEEDERNMKIFNDLVYNYNSSHAFEMAIIFFSRFSHEKCATGGELKSEAFLNFINTFVEDLSNKDVHYAELFKAGFGKHKGSDEKYSLLKKIIVIGVVFLVVAFAVVFLINRNRKLKAKKKDKKEVNFEGKPLLK